MTQAWQRFYPAFTAFINTLLLIKMSDLLKTKKFHIENNRIIVHECIFHKDCKVEASLDSYSSSSSSIDS